MPDAARYPRVGVAVGDAATREQLARWLLDERLRLVDGTDAPGLVAVLVDNAAWERACDRVREPGVPWILVGAERDWDRRLAAMRQGVRHFVGAPVTRHTVLRALRAAGIEARPTPAKVLIAGPEDAAGQAHAAVLAHAGFEVHRAHDPATAWGMLQREVPDMLVLREGLSDASLDEMMRLVHADAVYDGIMLLALLSHPDAARALPAGASFLLEPVAPSALRAAVADRSRRRRRWLATEASLLHVLATHEQERRALDAHALVSMADATGAIVYANDHFCESSGYRRDELVGKNHRIVKSGVHPPEVYAELWRTIAAGRIWQGELRNRRKDGRPYWVATTIVPIRSDDGSGARQYLSIRTDITAQKEAQFALAQQLERLEQMSRLARVGSWQLDADSRAMRWSDEAYRIHGLTPNDPIDPARALAFYDSEPARQQLQRAFDAALREGTPFEFELPMRDARGEPRWVRVLGTAQREGERVVRLTGAIQDITAFKQATQALQAARDEADRANRAKSEFLSQMSHELRTPMNAILGFGQLLELDIPAESRSHAHLREILKGGRHLLALIDDVLDLARIESGRLDLSFERVGVAEVAQDCLGLVQPLAARRGVTLEMDVDAALSVRADRVRLRQVLMNLLSNAIKYNVDAGHVHVGAADGSRGHVRVAVRDTGLGIPPQRQDELFQPFHRLGAEHGPIEGTGIGLFIVRQLIERMHGRVGVDSQPGRGSTFWFELPRSDDKTAESVWGQSTYAGLPAMAEQRVLYVDDNPPNLRLVERIFERWPGIALLTAQDPGLGLDLALAHRPDLILLDLQMAPIDGFRLLARVRQEPALRSVPVIAITADAMPRTLTRTREAGFDACLTKPFDVRRFIGTVERLLRRDMDTGP